MGIYRIESRDGRGYTIGTDNIRSALRSVEEIGRFDISDIVKVIEVKESIAT